MKKAFTFLASIALVVASATALANWDPDEVEEYDAKSKVAVADFKEGDRILHSGKFNWTYVLGTGLMDPWAIGATALIPAEGTDATTLPRLLAQSNATIFAAAPGVIALKSDGKVVAVVSKRKHRLIESLGETICYEILKDFPVSKVSICLRK